MSTLEDYEQLLYDASQTVEPVLPRSEELGETDCDEFYESFDKQRNYDDFKRHFVFLSTALVGAVPDDVIETHIALNQLAAHFSWRKGYWESLPKYKPYYDEGFLDPWNPKRKKRKIMDSQDSGVPPSSPRASSAPPLRDDLEAQLDSITDEELFSTPLPVQDESTITVLDVLREKGIEKHLEIAKVCESFVYAAYLRTKKQPPKPNLNEPFGDTGRWLYPADPDTCKLVHLAVTKGIERALRQQQREGRVMCTGDSNTSASCPTPSPDVIPSDRVYISDALNDAGAAREIAALHPEDETRRNELMARLRIECGRRLKNAKPMFRDPETGHRIYTTANKADMDRVAAEVVQIFLKNV